MKRLLFPALFLFVSAAAHAQLPQIRITGVFPPGAQRGTSLDVTVTAGTDLDEASELVFSHPGLKATQKLDAKGNPVANQFKVSVDPSIEPGLYDVRLRGLFGISNPRIFRIDTLPEIQETEPNNTNEQAQEVALNTIVNARSNGAADVDTFKIAAKAKQTIVIRSEAAVLDSLMQPVLELFDADGKRVAHSRRKKRKEAVVVFTSPKDQTLLLKIHDTVYAGSNDYGYRLGIDTRPLVDFVSPQVVQANVDSKVRIAGRYIPGGQPTKQTIDGTPLFSKEVSVKIAGAAHRVIGTDSSATSIDTAIYSGIEGNLIPFAVRADAAAATMEADAPDSPQQLTVPANVAGSFAKEMEEDKFRFDAKKGEQWQIDVLAHRLGSGADPMLIVEQITKAADGKETAKRLAREEAGKLNPGGANLPTLTSDPSFLLTAPADGTYQIRIKDRYAASRGAADLTYTLSINKPTPDFHVVLFDALRSADGKAPPGTGAISLRKGGTYHVTVYAYRTGGHNADIQLMAKGLPKGITAPVTTIRAGQNSAVLVLSAAADAPELAAPVQIIGVTTAEGKTIERSAKVATLVHAGANGLPRTGRVTGSLMVGIMKDEEPFHVLPAVTEAEITQDQQLLIPLKLTRRTGFDAPVAVAFAGQPKNVDIPKISFAKGKDAAVARFYFKENATVGKATLFMYATAAVPYSRNPWQVERAKAKVATAVAQLDATKKALEAAKASAAAGTKKVADLTAALKTYNEQLKQEQTAVTAVQTELKTAVAGKTAATKQLLALQEKLNAAAANKKPENEDLDAAIKAVQEATAAVAEASKPVTALVATIKQINTRIAEKQKQVAAKNKLIADATSQMKTQQEAVVKAKAAVTAAEANVKAKEAEKKAADDVTKKAEAAAKPKNINVRNIAIPVRLNVHTTPGKVVAAVPNKGAIKVGTSVDVKVTITRKNKFAGAVKAALVVPDGTKGLSSNTIDIAADKTEGTLKITVAADAPVADVANVVVRATGEFNGRQASFDAPVAIKITK